MIITSLGIRSKLLLTFLSIIIFTVICTTYFSIRATSDPLRDIINGNVKSMVDEFYTFLEANPDIDQSLIKKMCNEQITIGKTGFIFVINPKGDLLIHKKAGGKNWAGKSHIKKIMERKNGYLRYISPKTKTFKLAAFRFFEHRNWIIVASAFEDDFLDRPRLEILQYSIITGSIIIVFAAVIIFLFTVRITRPLKDATNLAQIIAAGDLTQRINQEQQDEFGILSRAMNQICEKMSESIGQVASASQQLAEGASEQAASIEETSSSLEVLSSMTKNNANNANQADNLMKEAGNAVTQANEFMSKLSISMDDISKANDETQKIIKTIDEIAFQTNLLALNAAVEAARAGEVGAGFSVVAEEVRTLALRSAEAAKNTAKMIEGTVAKTQEGLSLTQETGETFAGVVQVSSKAGKLIGEISAASKEQAQGIEQINIAVVEMDKVTQQNAAGAEELASSTAMFKTSN